VDKSVQLDSVQTNLGGDYGANAGARLDRLPLGAFHRRMLILVSLGLFLDAFDLFMTGGVLGALLKSGWSTLELNAYFVSATFFGLTLGAFLSGILSDRYGRRSMFQINLLIVAATSLAAAFAPNMYVLIVLRFLMGIGLGAEAVIGYALLVEMMPAGIRGRSLALSIFLTNVSLFASSFLGLWIIPTFGWQYMFAFVGVGSFIIWFLRKSMPESPRWLESKGQFKEADVLLRQIESDYPNLPPIEPRPVAPERNVSIAVLFHRDVWARTLTACMFAIVYGWSLYGFLGWLPSFFVKQGVSVASSLAFTTVMTLGGPAGVLIGFLLVDRLGRRPIMMFGPLLSAALGLLYPTMTTPVGVMATGLALVSSIYLWIAAGLTMQSELFATEYRFRGAGFASSVGRIATALIQFAIVPLFTWGGVHAIVGGLAGCMIILSASFWVFAPETGKKSLEVAADSVR
jgi:putative MFS transporter